MASTLHHPVLPVGSPEDNDFWEGYLKKVTDEDIQLIARWQKILDTLLIYVCSCLRAPITCFDNFEIGWTLHRRLDRVHHSSVQYVSTKSGGCNQQYSYFSLQPHHERFHTYKPPSNRHTQ